MRNFAKPIATATMAASFMLGAFTPSFAQSDELDPVEYAERSIRIVSTGRIHFEIADKLREASVSAMGIVGALPDVFADSYDVRDGVVDFAVLEDTVLRYRETVAQNEAMLEDTIAFVDEHKLNLPERAHEAVSILTLEAQTSFLTNAARVEQIVGDAVAFAKGEDNYFGEDDAQSEELRALILPLMSEIMRFTERSLDYEIAAIEPFVSEELGSPVHLGLGWEYLHHRRHVAKWGVTLGEGVDELNCTDDRALPNIEPLGRTLRALDNAFEDPGQIDTAASGTVFILTLQWASAEQIGQGKPLSQKTFSDAQEKLLAFETDAMAAVDPLLAGVSEENFASCARAEETAPSLQADLQTLLTTIPYHPRRRALRAAQYAEAINFYRALQAETARR